MEQPHSQEAESAVLGAVLFEPDKIDSIELSAKEFFLHGNSLLWGELKAMRASNKHMDTITIAGWLKDRGTLDAVGGYDRITELQSDNVVTGHSQSYAEEVRHKAKLRRLIDISNRGLTLAYSGEDATDDIVSALLKENALISKSDCSIEENWELARTGKIKLIPTPFPKMNQRIGGIRKRMHTIVCGRSGSGKSMLMAQWYKHLGDINTPIFVLPLEDKYDVTITRMAANHGKYNWSKIENGGEWVRVNGKYEWFKTTADDIRKAKASLDYVRSLPVYFDDRRATPDELRSRVIKAKARYGIEAVFVDGAKDIRRPTGKYNDTGFDEEISQCLCSIAEELDVAMVSVFHLTKIPDDQVIGPGNIRGSGNIVSDARAVFALQSKGLDSDGVCVNFDDHGNQMTRAFDLVKTNFSRECRVILDSDLGKVRFFEQ